MKRAVLEKLNVCSVQLFAKSVTEKRSSPNAVPRVNPQQPESRKLFCLHVGTIPGTQLLRDASVF